MNDEPTLFDRLKQRGEEAFTQLSAELMQNERFTKAMAGALRGKEMVDEAVTRALKTMNVPTRNDLRKATGRIEALEAEVAALKKKKAPAKRKAGPSASRATKRVKR